MDNRLYVYLILDPRKYYLPFYGDKGQGVRAYDHFHPGATRTRHPKNSKIKQIRADGFEPKLMFWKTDLSEESALELKDRFVRRDLHPDGLLTNLPNGPASRNK